jgi:regulator of protease activity HflC (stomatin/prohibitin superfamily)
MIKYPWSLDGKPPPPPRKRRWWERHLPGLSVTLMVVALLAVVLYPHMVITVPSGQVGVLWKRFNGFGVYCWCWVGRGTVLNPNELREEGLHIIWPWDRLFLYDLRLQTVTETYNAISSDGVSLKANLNIRFQVKHNSVAVLHKYIGPGYIASVVKPEIGSRAREIIAKYTAEQVYSTARQEIEDKIRENAQEKLGDHLNSLVQVDASEQVDRHLYRDQLKDSIGVLDTLILGIELPEPIVGAINRKTEQYYLVKEYVFRVDREKLEAERKQYEANGIAAFQRTVSQGISDSYLRWRGIEATLQLAQSNNTKIVVIGSSKDGLPIILGNVDSAAQTRTGGLPDGDKKKMPALSPGVSDKVPSSLTVTDGLSNVAGKKPDDASLTPSTSPSSTSSTKPDSKTKSSKSLSFADFEALLSRLKEVLQPSGSDTKSSSSDTKSSSSTETETPSK